MADDDFSGRYGDLLTGSYDCVDRIVLNAYFPLGHNPAGFRFWWRRLHGGSENLRTGMQALFHDLGITVYTTAVP